MGCHPSHWLSYFSRWLLHHQPVKVLILFWLVVWNTALIFPFSWEILGMSSSQLTKSIIFQRGGEKPPTRWGFQFFFALWCHQTCLGHPEPPSRGENAGNIEHCMVGICEPYLKHRNTTTHWETIGNKTSPPSDPKPLFNIIMKRMNNPFVPFIDCFNQQYR